MLLMPDIVSKKSIKTILYSHNPYCFYCKTLLSKKEITLDHIIPQSRGGLNIIENLVIACFRCNQSKGNKSIEDFSRQ